MARQPTQPSPPKGPPKLRVERNDARSQLSSRRELGIAIRDSFREIHSFAILDDAERTYEKWSLYNREMLRRMFTDEEYARDYDFAGVGSMAVAYDKPSLGRKVTKFFERLNGKIDFLEGLTERLDLIDFDLDLSISTSSKIDNNDDQRVEARRIFVVHGHDEEAKSIVARFLEHCELEPVILHEQADAGRTIIEKFEDNADVGFAVILLTPDDLGGSARLVEDIKSLNPRARQNVVLELGYFIGRLGRSRVCALRRGDVELPSDISGVIYTPFNSDEGWKLKLAREIKSAGIEIDLNKALV